MKIFGIELLLNEPLYTKFQALVAGACLFLITMGGGVGLILSIYFFFFTPLWWIIYLYFFWFYLDRNICENGGRVIETIQNWSFWTHTIDYFPARLELAQGFYLNPKRNYLFCCFPHGIIPMGGLCNITFNDSDFQRLYPEFQVKTAVLSLLLQFPFARDLGLALGGISCSAHSLYYFLKQPNGGYVITLYPGGAAEAFYAGKYKFIVKKRKGFIKIALQSGAGLVPAITFGENDLYRQIETPLIKKAQMYLKRVLGFAPILFSGRGLFQNSFGLIPKKIPIVTVLGKPIEVVKNENPTNEQIENLHERFTDELVKLFEKYKHKFLENPNETFLQLE